MFIHHNNAKLTFGDLHYFCLKNLFCYEFVLEMLRSPHTSAAQNSWDQASIGVLWAALVLCITTWTYCGCYVPRQPELRRT